MSAEEDIAVVGDIVKNKADVGDRVKNKAVVGDIVKNKPVVGDIVKTKAVVEDIVKTKAVVGDIMGMETVKEDIVGMNTVAEEEMRFSSLTERRLAHLVVDHLTKFGFCVIDDFLGVMSAEKIRSEVLELHSSQEEKNEINSIKKSRISWVNSSDNYAINRPLVGLQSLIKSLDSIIFLATKTLNIEVRSRSKALFSVQTKQNSISQNGPSIEDIHSKSYRNSLQAIYYPNNNWNSEVHGGMMEVFSSVAKRFVGDVYPIFDRIIIIWGDTRTTKRLKKSFSERLEINIWYFYDLKPIKEEDPKIQTDSEANLTKKREGLEYIISDLKRQKSND